MESAILATGTHTEGTHEHDGVKHLATLFDFGRQNRNSDIVVAGSRLNH